MLKKHCITLVELLISISITSVLMILMFSIISKKASFVAYYDKGTYYCWKDWSGNLYQKIPSGSITSVAECSVKIPKNAKNIKVYLIGGGSGGYAPSESAKTKIITDAKNAIPHSYKDAYCAYTGKTYNGYTHVFDNNLNKIKVIDIEKLMQKETEISYRSINSNYFGEKFSEFLLQHGHCCLPMQVKNQNGFSEKNYIVPANIRYYSKGTDGTFDCDNKYCYKLGYFIDVNKKLYDPSNSDSANTMNQCPRVTGKDINTLYLEIYPTDIRYSGYKESEPGKVTFASALAGQEYRITKDDIGSGGSVGENGKDTKFSNFSASGGELTNSSSKIIRLPVNKINYDFDKITNPSMMYSYKFCDNIFNCNAKYNSELDGISDIEFNLNKVNEINQQFDISKEDDIIKKGFGLFGISGLDAKCTLKYKNIKSVRYNKFYKINYNYNPQIECVDKFTKGMGGAIIIKWD